MTEFTHNDATVTFRKGTIRDRMHLNALIEKLNESIDETMHAAAYAYAYLIARADVDGDLGIELPDASASIEELTEGFEAFLEADEELYDLAMRATGLTDDDPND